jgi:hypothetical protein
VLSGCPGDREALFKAIRKHENMRTSRLGIGLDEALREKEAINETRTRV